MSCVASAAASRVAPRVPAADGARRRDRVSRGARRPGARRWPPPRRLPPWTSPRSRTRGSPGASIGAPWARASPACARARWRASPRARMPTQRVEDYRFTDLAPLVGAQPAAADPAAAAGVDASAWTLEGAATTRVVLVDGVFCAALSDLSGVPGAAGRRAPPPPAPRRATRLAPSPGPRRRLRGPERRRGARRRDRHRARRREDARAAACRAARRRCSLTKARASRRRRRGWCWTRATAPRWRWWRSSRPRPRPEPARRVRPPRPLLATGSTACARSALGKTRA